MVSLLILEQTGLEDGMDKAKMLYTTEYDIRIRTIKFF